MKRPSVRPQDPRAVDLPLCAGTLVLLLFTLVAVPVASANPVDPTWTSGLYDNADYDDVTLLIASPDGWLCTLQPAVADLPTVGGPLLLDAPASVPGLVPAPLPEIRAPPA